jgi:regulatory protein
VRPARPRRTLKQRAIALLARREYARAELGMRLAAAGADRADIESLLDELQRLGYLSDARFASALVRQKSAGYAKRAIEHSLRERGVARDAAREALAELDAADEFARAFALWQRRFGTVPVDERSKARQMRFLLSRGYALGIASRVLRQAGARVEDD